MSDPNETAAKSRARRDLEAEPVTISRAEFYDMEEEIERLRAALQDVREFLSNPDWGTVRYMEGSEVYTDIQSALHTVNLALHEDAKNG